MNLSPDNEPPEKESGAPHEQDAANFVNPTRIADVNAAGLGFEGGNLVPIVDGRAATEFKWEKRKVDPAVDGLVVTEFDEPEAAEAVMLPGEIRTKQLVMACWRKLAGEDERTLTAIADEFGVTRAAASKQWRFVLKRSGLALLYNNAAKRAKLAASMRRHHAKKAAGVSSRPEMEAAKLSARARDYHARSKKKGGNK